MRSVRYEQDIPRVLETLDLPGITKYIQSDACKNIFVMAGAGISTSAGIPDFRSPDTGLYANLARLKLPYPEAVFDITFFRRNPKPFYTLAHELAPGKFRPTLTHSFIRLLAEKEYLHTCFTQNIDTLERRAGLCNSTLQCKADYPDAEMKEKIDKQELPICKKCKGYVKPDIVFFGEGLPVEFFSGMKHLRSADLLIVMGTSLTVHPFASLTEIVDESCPRLLLNLDLVGGWGSRANDVSCLIPCDTAVRQLCKLLGWEEELDSLWAETANTVVNSLDESETGPKEETKKSVEEPEKRAEAKLEKAKAEKQAKADALEEFVGQLAEKIKDVGLDDKVERLAATKIEIVEGGNDPIQLPASGSTDEAKMIETAARAETSNESTENVDEVEEKGEIA